MSRLGRWWRKHLHVEPAIEPVEPTKKVDTFLAKYGAKDDDDLWVTCMSQAPNYPDNNEPNPFDTPIVDVPPFETPVRDGKPATIYVWHNHEFSSADEVDDIIESIKYEYHQKIREETKQLRKVKKYLS